jgi:hypothetical protein
MALFKNGSVILVIWHCLNYLKVSSIRTWIRGSVWNKDILKKVTGLDWNDDIVYKQLGETEAVILQG